MSDHPKLYKYRPLSSGIKYVRESVLEHKFYFNSPDRFNDPFECLPAFSFQASEAELIEYYKGIVKRNRRGLSEYAATIEAIAYRTRAQRQVGTAEYTAHHLDGYKKRVLPKLPMFCASATCQSVLMWSHYAADHTGVCLELAADSGDFDEIKPVEYLQDRPAVNLVTEPRDPERMQRTVLIKAKDWAYEQEWRLIRANEAAGVRVFKPESLTGIIFGARTPPSDKAIVMDWVKERRPKLRVMQATIALDTYSVDIIDA